MKDKTIKIIFISFITMAILCVIGLSYAYFSLEVEGTGKDIVMNTGDLRLEYKDETELKLTDAVPGDSVTKVITVSNVGTKSATYSLYWGDLINTIENYELHVTLDCKSYINYNDSSKTENGTCNNIYRAVPISSTKTSGYIKKGISIDPGVTQEYSVTIKFDNKTYPQNDNLNKKFTGKIGIEEYQAPETVYCTFDGDMVQGAEYTNGQYTYRYMQEGISASSKLQWNNITTDGWGVQLTDKTSTEPVTSEVCTYINNKPVVSMSYMYASSRAKTLDVSNFDTSKVTSMQGMFAASPATTLDLSNFNTSKVIDMSSMFYYNQAAAIDLSSFDTSKVTNMSSMFYYNQATAIDLSSFDTSNVTNMNEMFSDSNATTLDVSHFNTSKVTNMNGMFFDSQATTLDLSSFNTSNVTNMSSMFSSSKTSTLDVSNFDTSSVTNMYNMFSGSKATTLDVSNFNTSNVTDMSFMFSDSNATTLDVSHFNTSKVTNMIGMFSNSKATTLDVSNFDTSNVTNMSRMFNYCKATTLDLSNFDTSNVTRTDYMFYNCNDLKTIYASSKFVTTNVTSSTSMFSATKNLVGGSGTKYNSNYVDKTYARIDGGTSSPGYFTNK